MHTLRVVINVYHPMPTTCQRWGHTLAIKKAEFELGWQVQLLPRTHETRSSSSHMVYLHLFSPPYHFSLSLFYFFCFYIRSFFRGFLTLSVFRSVCIFLSSFRSFQIKPCQRLSGIVTTSYVARIRIWSSSEWKRVLE